MAEGSAVMERPPAVPVGTPRRTRAATDAPSAIGSLVASFGALELQKLLSGLEEQALVGRELYWEGRHHQSYVTRLTRNPACRFDHRTWRTEEVDGLTLGEALALGGASPDASELAVEDDAFVAELRCRGCGCTRAPWKLRRRLVPGEGVCEGCGAPLLPAGFDLLERLTAKRLPAPRLRRPLREFGLRPGDVFSIRSAGGEAHYRLALRETARRGEGAAVVLAGCGAIGSHLVPHLARMPGLQRVVLVDPDVYEAGNLRGQDIRPADVGRAKVEVQAERLLRIRPDLEVVARLGRLEDLPYAHFRQAFLLGALDSRLARQLLNQVAWRAGSPWIDMAVGGPGLLCRISVYRPAVDAPCIECGWDADDYRFLNQVWPCQEFEARTGGQYRGGPAC